jgi:hypothetical protein
LHLVRQVGFGLVVEQQPHDRLVAIPSSQGQACGSALHISKLPYEYFMRTMRT